MFHFGMYYFWTYLGFPNFGPFYFLVTPIFCIILQEVFHFGLFHFGLFHFWVMHCITLRLVFHENSGTTWRHIRWASDGYLDTIFSNYTSSQSYTNISLFTVQLWATAFSFGYLQIAASSDSYSRITICIVISLRELHLYVWASNQSTNRLGSARQSWK